MLLPKYQAGPKKHNDTKAPAPPTCSVVIGPDPYEPAHMLPRSLSLISCRYCYLGLIADIVSALEMHLQTATPLIHSRHVRRFHSVTVMPTHMLPHSLSLISCRYCYLGLRADTVSALEMHPQTATPLIRSRHVRRLLFYRIPVMPFDPDSDSASPARRL